MSEKIFFFISDMFYLQIKFCLKAFFPPSTLNMSLSSDLQNFWQVGKKKLYPYPSLFNMPSFFLLRLRIFLITFFLAFLIWYVLFCDYWGVYSVYSSYNIVNVCIYNFIIFKTSVTIVPWTFFPAPQFAFVT